MAALCVLKTNRRRPHRALHLIDIENLAGSGRPSRPDLRAALVAYTQATHIGAEDLTILGCNHGLALEAGLAWPGGQLVVRSGPDGADLALLDSAPAAHVAQRFDRLWIGSGDAIFSDLVQDLLDHGLAVGIVSRPEALSRRLRATGCDVVPLGLPALAA